MQFRDLQAQYQVLKSQIDSAVTAVMTDADFISGRKVSELEEQLAAYVGVKHCISCGNGTDALTLALMALDIGAGDAVFVPDFTFFASGETVAYEGAVPIFVDVREDTLNICSDSFEKAIWKVKKEGKLIPRAVVTVDLFGQPADYSRIKEIAKEYGLAVIEDAAQGFGGAIDGKRACSFGDISTTSFFPAKPLGCYGDGGAVFTDNDKWAELIRSLRIHGKGTDKYDNIRIGVNSRLDTIQAAILQVKLKAFEEYELLAVNQAAEFYSRELKDVVKIPTVMEGFYSSWAQYTIVLDSETERDALQEQLKAQNIPSMIYYPKPMHEQTAFAGMDCCKVELDRSSSLCKRVLSLPIHPYIKKEDQEKVIEVIHHFK